MSKLNTIKNSRWFYSAIGLVIIMVISSLLSPVFFGTANFISIARQASILLIMSAGLTGVILLRGVDLSVSATAAFVACIAAQMLKLNIPISIVIVLGIMIGAAVGLFNGFLIGKVGLEPFVATYATNWVISGLSMIIMGGAVIYGLPEKFVFMGIGYVGPIPIPVIIAIVIVIFFYILLQKTTFGRDVYSIGSNSTAAKYSAIPVYKRTLTVYALASAAAGLAGLILAARLNAAEVAIANSFGLQTVAAVVIGGTSMLGGEGGIIGTLVGALILTVIVNIMNLMGISSSIQPIVVGFVIISAVMLDVYNTRRQKNKD